MSSIKYDRLYSGSDGRSCVEKNLEIEGERDRKRLLDAARTDLAA